MIIITNLTYSKDNEWDTNYINISHEWFLLISRHTLCPYTVETTYMEYKTLRHFKLIFIPVVIIVMRIINILFTIMLCVYNFIKLI